MLNSQMVDEIAARNSVRASAGLPLLDSREASRLNDAERRRLVAAVFESERDRFEVWICSVEGFWARAGRWSKARRLVAAELKMGCHTEQVLFELGCMVEKARWRPDGSRTFTLSNADNEVFRSDLDAALAEYGWIERQGLSHALVNVHSRDVIEFG